MITMSPGASRCQNLLDIGAKDFAVLNMAKF